MQVSETGLMPSGDRRTKIKSYQLEEIFEKIKAGKTKASIAKEYGVDKTTLIRSFKRLPEFKTLWAEWKAEEQNNWKERCNSIKRKRLEKL